MSENTGNREGKLTTEEIAILEKAKRPVMIANRFRLFFLFASVVLVIAIYLINKFGAGTGGYEKLSAWLYLFLLLDIVLMLLSVFIKIGCAVRYNHILKKL